MQNSSLILEKNNTAEATITFDISTYLSFLISLRKVIFFTICPKENEFKIMEHFVRCVSNNCRFPREGEIEEEIKQVLTLDISDQEKFILKHFLMRNIKVLQLHFHLNQLTTKPTQK